MEAPLEDRKVRGVKGVAVAEATRMKRSNTESIPTEVQGCDLLVLEKVGLMERVRKIQVRQGVVRSIGQASNGSVDEWECGESRV